MHTAKFLWRGWGNAIKLVVSLAAVIVKAINQRGLHDILSPSKVASILATIFATSCSAERSSSALRRIVRDIFQIHYEARPLSNIAVINIESKYENKTIQNNMHRIIDMLGLR